ncbi:hypothetical protein A3C73_04865 [Candidatus Giovannonibacteria bacterium RIFCSPHIGHO2_02_FULL_44_11]|nr:MAG: hypothetical protein A3C73_04865 [Candidatus Giovannonibacteria bacterium RIFCSPHIGHO2_02_FULL_44_11]
MAGKKIISDVIISRRKKEASKALAEKVFLEEAPIVHGPVPEKIQKTPRKKLKFSGIVMLILVFVLGFLAVRALNAVKMTVNITPRAVSLAVDKSLVLARSGGGVLFTTATLSHPLSGSFPAEESKIAEKKAEGTVVIYNNSSKDAQILVASTRLETPEGKIYRIPSTVVVPGTRVENGKTMPGSKEVKVVADKPGADYNIGLTDFTFPGLKDSPKFETVFARSKTEMTGGFFGTTKLVSKNAVDTASAFLVNELNKSLKNIISKELVPGQFFLPGSEEFAVLLAETTPKAGEASADKFDLKLNGNVRWATVKMKDIASALTLNSIDPASLGKGETQIKNPDALAFKLSGYKFDAASFSMNIKGNARIEAALDPAEIKNRIAEAYVTDAPGVLELVPGAARAEVKFSPFWAGSLPRAFFNPAGNPDHIDITIVSR